MSIGSGRRPSKAIASKDEALKTLLTDSMVTFHRANARRPRSGCSGNEMFTPIDGGVHMFNKDSVHMLIPHANGRGAAFLAAGSPIRGDAVASANGFEVGLVHSGSDLVGESS